LTVTGSRRLREVGRSESTGANRTKTKAVTLSTAGVVAVLGNAALLRTVGKDTRPGSLAAEQVAENQSFGGVSSRRAPVAS
jgi:hypothetical protein